MLSEYGMVLVLFLLCVYYSAVTIADQYPEGAVGGSTLAREVARQTEPGARVLIVAGEGRLEAEFAEALETQLTAEGKEVVTRVQGQPFNVRQALQQVAERRGKLDAIAASQSAGGWSVLEDIGRKFPALGDVPVFTPHGYSWPNFLTANNLLNIANQIAVIAMLAAGMTFVVITGGIDLSVGSLVALSAVTATLLIRGVAGAEDASAAGMVACCVAAVVICGGVGLFSGTFVTYFNIPSFIVTLSVMLIARGLAFKLAAGQSIFQVPTSFVWLGGRADLGRVPNAVVLTILVYCAAHLVMTRTVLGRHIYAVGGNPQAARLSGIRVGRVVLITYMLSGALAGLGGIVVASQLSSGSPTYGAKYELHAIAAVAVGGTSLLGGRGKVLGTLIGALIIAVIKNGMNLTGVDPYTQDVVFGAVILGAVLFDEVKARGWTALQRMFFARKNA
jgi:ribose transport system permease protein